jgi:serine/threonine protein kinase
LQNILLDGEGNIKLSDFGFATSCIEDGKERLLRTVCGTPNYMAPEILNSECGYDGKKADVWSLGVILFVLLAGYLPYEASTKSALFEKISVGHVEYPAWFSTEVKELLTSILVVNPAERISLRQFKRHSWIVNGIASDGDSDKSDIASVSSGMSSIDLKNYKNDEFASSP